MSLVLGRAAWACVSAAGAGSKPALLLLLLVALVSSAASGVDVASAALTDPAA
jgi:hypothetical protein